MLAFHLVILRARVPVALLSSVDDAKKRGTDIVKKKPIMSF